MKRGDRAFDTSSKAEDAEAQVAIRKWFVFSTLKNAFGGSSDTTLTRLRELLNDCGPRHAVSCRRPLQVAGDRAKTQRRRDRAHPRYAYQGRYTNLVLSLLYPDRDWKDAVFHEDHIFPQSEFKVRGAEEAGVRRGEGRSLLVPVQHALQPSIAHGIGEPVKERHAF